MKRFFKTASTVLFALASVAMGAVAEGDCKSRSYGGITVSYIDSKCVAVIDGDSEASTTISNVTVDSVAYVRSSFASISTMAFQTVVFPFSAESKCVANGSIAEINEIDYSEEVIGSGLKKWKVTGQSITFGNKEVKVNKPYIIYLKAADKRDGITFNSSCSYTLGMGTVESTDLAMTAAAKAKAPGSFKFVGTYSKILWDKDHSDLGSVYGFAAKNASGATVGQFVKAGADAYIKPFRAYLKYTKPAAGAKRAAISSVESIDTDLPESFDVVLYDENGAPMSIGHMNTATGSVVMDSRDLWFDLKGRMMDRKPTVKGTYYHKGQKVVIK